MATKRDIPAIDKLKSLSRDWSGIRRPSSKPSFDDLKQFQSRVNDVTTKTLDGVKSVQGYVNEVGDEISTLCTQVKSSMIENVQILAGLVDKLVPAKKAAEIPQQRDLPDSGSAVSLHGVNPVSNYSGGPPKRIDNEMVARQCEESSKVLEQQQQLTLFLGDMKHTCEKVRSQNGITSEDIENLQSHLKNYGDTLENEQERQDREKKQKKETEREEMEEKKRIEEEKRRRNPENWKPLVYEDRSERGTFADTDVLCVVYAMDGSFYHSSLQCTNMEGQPRVADWLYTPYEQQASCPTMVRYTEDSSLDLKVSMEVYVPYSIKEAKFEAEVKISIDNGQWKYPEVLSKRKIDAFPKGVDFIGTTVQKFESFRIVVVAVHKKRKLVLDKNGFSFKEDCMHFQIPPEFGNDKIKVGVSTDNDMQRNSKQILGAQVSIEVDCMDKTTKDINVKISPEQLSSHCKEKKVVGAAVNQYLTTYGDLSNFRLDPFLTHLQTEGVVNTKEAHDNKNQKTKDKRIKHLFEMLIDKPSASEKVLVCLDKSGNEDIGKTIRELVKEKRGDSVVEEKWRSVIVYREDGGKWIVLDPKLTAKLHKELGCTLHAGNRRFDLASLTVPGDSSEKDIEGIADEFGKVTFGTTVTLICKHKTDEYQGETFVHVLPTEQASNEISRLKKAGYTRGPMELADFTIMDGDTVELYMSGNIGLEHKGRRIPQGEVVKFPYKAQKDVSKENCNIYVVDKTAPDQMDDDRYRGLLHYRVRARKPLTERTDSVEVVWIKTTKQYLSHLSMNGDIQALAKFVGSKVINREEMHSIFIAMDTPDVVKQIEARVEKQCKNDTDSVRFETTLFIWANQNQEEKERKIEKILHTIGKYPWCNDARQFVELYRDKGLFSEVSLLSMSMMLGPEWKDLAITLKLPEAQLDYIQSMKLSEQFAKGKMLDKYRLSHRAIILGDRLPGEFVQALQQCHCSAKLLAYVKTKVK